MNRRHLTFTCEGATLAATLDMDPATGSTALLFVSGGNEVRAGACGAQARLAARLAAAGVSVLRYDRRGVGESEGENAGFRSARADISAALAALRAAAPQVRRVVAFGNCDAASALMLFAADLPVDALVLANPWTIEGDESAEAETHAPGALRSRYLAKLTNPREVMRLLTGGVNLRRLGAGLRRAAGGTRAGGLAQDMAAGLARFAGPVGILLAGRDRTAQLFAATWPRGDARIAVCHAASHGFVEPDAQDWLLARLIEATASRH